MFIVAQLTKRLGKTEIGAAFFVSVVIWLRIRRYRLSISQSIAFGYIPTVTMSGPTNLLQPNVVKYRICIAQIFPDDEADDRFISAPSGGRQLVTGGPRPLHQTRVDA